MKSSTRLCAFLCILVLLMNTIACTNITIPEPPETTTAETSSETEPPLTTTPGAETTSPTDPKPEEPVCLRHLNVAAIRRLSWARLTGEEKTDPVEQTYLSIKPAAADPWIVIIQAQPIEGARYLQIRYRTTSNIRGRLYLGKTDIGEIGSMPVGYNNDGQWHTLEIDLFQSVSYADTIGAMRFDPMDGVNLETEAIDIAWIAFYPDNSDNPTAGLPALPEDSPNLESYQKTPDGSVYYRAQGQLSGNNGTYTFKENFRLELYRRGYFNRYTLGYSSTSPIRGEITYLLWDANHQSTTRTETFFLEAGQNKTFSSLIDGYFDRNYAYGVTGITMKTCDGSTATFTLQSLTDIILEIHPTTYYLENDRYKLGVLLSWGGGISYIEDKQDGDPRMNNLINRADPGRLVQQSYYGVKDGPYYTGAYYGDTLWGYNPVQGGDLYGNGSKLVDVRIDPDGKSMYIKCRPMDWAHNASATPSYMENTYTLTDRGIHVANRFVDFFGVEHPARHAELPAFYTISYLGTFHYYNGSKPWTGDAYTTLPNEPFWAGNKNAYHNIVKGNTETWAAWTNPEGYGIGLYVPGTEIMLAGRHEYNGSKDPLNGGTSYVAPLKTMAIQSFVPFEYDYIIAAGTIDEMRATFKDFAGK